MTFDELRLKAIRAAQNLQRKGFEPRQKFCFMTTNHDDLLPIVLAAIGLTCPIVPLSPILSKAEIIRILTKLKPPVLFCDAALYATSIVEVFNELQFNIKVFTFGQIVAIDGIEPVESLFQETGKENTFVLVK